MTDAPETPPTEEEMQAAFQHSMAFNSEAVRAGLFAACLDIAEELRKANIPHGEACLLTGAAEFVAQLWQQVGSRGGIQPMKTRKTMLKEIEGFYGKHVRLAREAAQIKPPMKEQANDD